MTREQFIKHLEKELVDTKADIEKETDWDRKCYLIGGQAALENVEKVLKQQVEGFMQ